MLGCLLVAAAIGSVVGWLLRHRSAVSDEHQLTDRETELRIKAQALDTATVRIESQNVITHGVRVENFLA